MIEGVPERFPRLKIVFIEAGSAGAGDHVADGPALRALRDEVPHLKRTPSEYVREHFWFTTQPIEEPDNAGHLRRR